MKKIYTNPALNVVMLDCDDIVTASSETLEVKGGWDGGTASAKQRNNIWDEDE